MAEDSEWKVHRKDWYNDRIMETFISAPIIDKQNDMIPTETMEESMDFFMKYGVYSFKHEEQPIGLPLAWKTEDGKVKIKVGIHSGLDMHDHAWKQIKEYGTKGGSSIRGEATDQKIVCNSEDQCYTKINELGLWSVSWVEDHPANPDALVTQVAAMAKSVEKATESVEAPNGYHWMDYKGGPVLMEGDYEPHDGASAEYSFEVIEEHDPDLLKGCGCGCKGNKSENMQELKYDKDRKDNIKEVDSMTEEEKSEPEVIAPEEATEEVKEEEITEEVKEEEDDEVEMEDEEEEKTSKDMSMVRDALMAALKYLSEDKMEDPEELEASADPETPTEEVKEDAKENLSDAIKTLKKNGFNVYAGKKRTPAVKAPEVTKPQKIDFSGVSKTIEELDLEYEKEFGGN
jgi:hypothetical protein